ncbi:hypothetical protein Hypma_004272 [Hypsizygus marmoreus]|uniref:Uncharacterized protein n=1 Tax=Hypsizygus marmoreus TaxID=39966 RepID=A0A369J0D9_HYPMA|nr:hypothetical protein Hypma_004272 [Hypsizygus marmoreus]
MASGWLKSICGRCGYVFHYPEESSWYFGKEQMRMHRAVCRELDGFRKPWIDLSGLSTTNDHSRSSITMMEHPDTSSEKEDSDAYSSDGALSAHSTGKIRFVPEFYAAPADREMPAYNDIQFHHELCSPSWRLRVSRKTKRRRSRYRDDALVQFIPPPSAEELRMTQSTNDDDNATTITPPSGPAPPAPTITHVAKTESPRDSIAESEPESSTSDIDDASPCQPNPSPKIRTRYRLYRRLWHMQGMEGIPKRFKTSRTTRHRHRQFHHDSNVRKEYDTKTDEGKWEKPPSGSRHSLSIKTRIPSPPYKLLGDVQHPD